MHKPKKIKVKLNIGDDIGINMKLTADSKG